MWVKHLIDRVLAEEFAAPDLEFAWDADSDADPSATATIATDYCWSGAFVRYPLIAERPADVTVDDALLHDLAKNTTELYVSAYDRESYVIWRR